MSPAGAGADGFGSGFFQPVVEDGLGMRRGPAIGQHLFETHVIRMQTQEEFTNITPRLDPMTLRTREDCVQHSRSWTRCFAS